MVELFRTGLLPVAQAEAAERSRQMFKVTPSLSAGIH